MSTIDCSICSETFGKTESSDEVVTPCGHIYHGHCLSDWLNSVTSSKTCPECRNPMIMQSCRRVYFHFSNDVSNVQPFLEYLQTEITAKSNQLQIVNSENKRLRHDINNQLRTKEHECQMLREKMEKMQQKLKEKKFLRRAESFNGEHSRNNQNYWLSTGQNIPPIYHAVQSSNTGTVNSQESRGLNSIGAPMNVYPENKMYRYGPSNTTGTTAFRNSIMNDMSLYVQQWQQHSRSSNSAENWNGNNMMTSSSSTSTSAAAAAVMATAAAAALNRSYHSAPPSMNDQPPPAHQNGQLPQVHYPQQLTTSASNSQNILSRLTAASSVQVPPPPTAHQQSFLPQLISINSLNDYRQNVGHSYANQAQGAPPNPNSTNGF